MALYNVKHTNSAKSDIEIHEEEVNTSRDVTLFGRKRLGYGQEMNANLLHILENFALPEEGASDIGWEPGPANEAMPDLALASTRGDAITKLLSEPTEGQAWFNKSRNILYSYDGSSWVPSMRYGFVAANSGVIADGGTLPIPTSPAMDVTFARGDCSWIVSPMNFPANIDFMVCSADEDGLVTVQYSFPGSDTLISGYANYLIVGISGNASTGMNEAPPEPTPTPTVTPTVTVSPTVSTTPTPTITVTPTVTDTPTPTPTNTPEPTVTPTQSVTPGPPSPTASNTPTPTPTMTPSNLPTGVSVSDHYVFSDDVLPGIGKAGFRLNANGNAEQRLQNAYSVLETWLDTGVNSDYQVRATLTGGVTPNGTLDTWLSLSTSREWNITEGGSTPSTSYILIEIRSAATGVVIDTANIEISAATTPE